MPTIKKKAYAARKHQEQEILTLAHRISAFLTANKKIFTMGLSALAVMLLIVTGFSLKRSMDEQAANPLLNDAYAAYRPAAGLNPDYAKALELFRNVQKQYPSSLSGTIAAYYVGNCLMDLGRNEEALREYENFVGKHRNDTFLLGLVYGRMGLLYKALGKQADAIKAFEQSDALIGPGMATMELARLYEATGNGPESQKKYKIIADKLAGTMWAMEAMGKVQKIENPPISLPGKKGK